MLSIEEQSRQLEYIKRILGSPYVLNGQSFSQGVDCFSCMRIIEKELFFRNTPAFQIEEDTPKGYIQAVLKGKREFNWVQIDEPVNGCVVELTRGNTPHHVGVYFELPHFKIKGLVHALKGAGVIYDPMNTLKGAGWKRFTYNVPRNS